MFTSSKILMAMIWMWLISQLVCNWYEGQTMYNNVTMSGFTGYSTTTQTDALNNAVRAPSVASSIIDAIGKIFLWDYSVFKDLDAGLDANGNYQDNGFVFIRYLLIGIGAVVWLALAIVFFNFIGSLLSRL